MAKILIVDDRPSNRQFLVTLLGYGGHRLIEAANGVEALERIRSERPQLLITDILMPTMDGFELVRQLRADPDQGQMPVIFYTATYSEPQARELANSCGVRTVLPKPSEPERILEAVREALGATDSAPQPTATAPAERKSSRWSIDDSLNLFVRELQEIKDRFDSIAAHAAGRSASIEFTLQLSKDFSENVISMQRIASRLSAIVEVGMELTSERDPVRLVELFFGAACDIIDSEYAAAALLDAQELKFRHICAKGVDAELYRTDDAGHKGLLGSVISERRVVRIHGAEWTASMRPLAQGHPPVRNLLAVPIATSERVYGWFYFADRRGADEFGEDDERLASIMATKLALLYENALLYDLVQKRAADLQIEIGARQQAQVALEASENRYRSIFEAAVEGIFLNSREGRVMTCNLAGARMLGYDSPEEVVADVSDLGHQVYVDDEDRRKLLLRLDMEQVVRDCEMRYRRKDGSIIWVSVGVRVVGDAFGTVPYLLAIIQDISDRKRAEEDLRRFKLALDESADMIVLTDRATMRHVDVNQTACKLLGYTKEELLRMGPADLLPVSREELEQTYDRLIANPSLPDGMRSYYRRKDGSHLPFESTRRVMRSADTWIIAAVSRDIRERIASESILRDSEVRFRETFELAGSGMAHIALDGRFLRVNRRLCEMLGYQEGEIIGRSVKAISHPDDRDVTDAPRARLRSQEVNSASFEKRYLRKDGSVIWVMLTVALARNSAGEPDYEISVLEDISERRRMAQEVLQAERRFRSIFDNATEGIFLSSRDGRLITSNPSNVRMLGYDSPDELIAAVADAGAQLYVEPEDQRRMLAMLDASGSVHGFETRMRRKDGEVIWASVSARVVSDDTGAASHVLGMSQDITRQKRANQILDLEHAVARHLAGAESGPDGLEAVIRMLCESEGWEVGRFWQVDETAGVLRFGGSWGKVDTAIARFTKESRDVVFAAGVGLAGMVWQSGEPLWASDTSNDPRVAQSALARNAGMRGAFVFPVASDGKMVGVIGISSREVRPPDDRLLAAVRVIGGQIGQFLRRKQGENRIKRLNRVYAVLSGINAAIVRIRDRDALFLETCRIAVEAGHFTLSYVYVVDPLEQRLKLVASAGPDAGFLEELKSRLVLSDDAPEGYGADALAVREKRAAVVNSMENDSRIRRKKAYLERGIRSLAVLPLLVGGEPVAVLGMHSAEAGFFDEEEMKLLTQLAADISFALDHIDKAGKLNYLAFYDQLTGLANRALFLERLDQSIRSAGRAGGKIALTILDIERLRIINDSLGRQAGDTLIKHVAEYLKSTYGASGVGRIGPDHFALILGEVKGRSQASRAVGDILHKCFGKSFQVSGADLRISAKAGAALFPSDGTDAEVLLGNTEAALRKAKDIGERYVLFTPELAERTVGRLTLENQLRQALEKEEFVLHYQPKVDLETRQIVGVEALIRWQSPALGLVPPMKFIPLLEETGLILDVGSWALRRAAADHRGWVEQRLLAPRVAVNVSAIQLRQGGFVDAVAQAIIEGVAPTGIDLEITESLVMEDIEGNIRKLEEVRALGVSIAIDDFGTGYSSLAYLAKLPVQTLKIDRSFIITMLDDADTMTLVQTIISLAHSMRLRVVAEGVEEEEQAKMLRLLRCDQMQGYLFSKPMPLDAMTALLKQGNQG